MRVRACGYSQRRVGVQLYNCAEIRQPHRAGDVRRSGNDSKQTRRA